MDNFIQIFAKSGGVQSSLTSPVYLPVSLLFTMAGAFIMLVVYRLCHSSLTYHKKFNVTLLMLSFVSTVLLTLVQNNPLLTIGVVGSLSICRIRTNTKDPRDIGFVFWALAIGISSAAGAFAVEIGSTMLLGILMLFMSRTVKKRNSLLLVVRGQREQSEKVQDIFLRTKGTAVQSKNFFADSFELVYELRIRDEDEQKILRELNAMEGIYGVNVLAPETKVAEG